MTAEEVRARVAAQLTDEERARVADVLLDNDGEPERLDPPGEPPVDRPRQARSGCPMRRPAVGASVSSAR